MHEEDELRFNWHDQPENFLKWMLTSCIASMKVDFDALKAATNDFTDVVITMQVNGIEVPAKGFIDGIQSNMDWEVNQAAKRLVNDSVDGLIDGLHDIFAQTQHSLREK